MASPFKLCEKAVPKGMTTISKHIPSNKFVHFYYLQNDKIPPAKSQ